VALLPDINTKWRDQSRRGNDGTITSATLKHRGRFGPCLYFDGVNDIVETGDLSSYFPVSTGTILAWINHEEAQTGGRGIIAFSNWRPLLYLADNLLVTLFAASTGLPVGDTATNQYAVITYDTWHLVGFRWNAVAGTYTLWHNGAALESGTDVTFGALTANTSRYGSYGGANWFKGWMDQVMIFNRELEDYELIAIFNQGKP